MAITKPICDICGSTKSNGWMCQGAYQVCSKCNRDISLFDTQPMKDSNLKILLEVFFRRGKGEDIRFKDIHKEKSSFKLITFADIFANVGKSEVKG